jgi:RNA polymerase sigma factor (sigma-70 family)
MSNSSLSAVELEPYEGLIFTTARRFATRCGMEEEDLRQELRLKAAQAVVKYDSSRSRQPLANWVFSLIVNRVTDLRRTHMRQRLSVGHIEDFRGHSSDGSDMDLSQFELRYFHLDHDTVYGRIDEGGFVMPATLTERETNVLRLLLLDYSKVEAAKILGLTDWMVYEAVERLREKLSDWHPTSQPDNCSVVGLHGAELPVAA